MLSPSASSPIPLSSPCQYISWILGAYTMVSSLWGSQGPPTEEKDEDSVKTGLNTGEF